MAKPEAKKNDFVEIRLVRTDLPAKDRRGVQEAVRILYARNVKDGDAKRSKLLRWSDFAKCLRSSLDASFGPSWHVLVGNSLGFACKKRNQTMGWWKMGDDAMVVIFKSPGIEEPAPADDAKADSTTDGDPATDEDSKPPALHVLQPAKVEEGSNEQKVIKLLQEELHRSRKSSESDTQILAQRFRKRLTAEIGPIWHVLTGTEFVAEPAEARRNFVLAVAGKTRIVCFQHEEFANRGVGLFGRIDFSKLWSALPYLLLLLTCLAYMTMNSVCQDDQPKIDNVWTQFLRRKLCRKEWETDVQILGGITLAVMFFSRGTKMWSKAKEKMS